MNKALLNYFVDLGMAISFGIVAVTGILKHPALGGRARDYMALHDWAGIALAAFVLLHLILHWNWIKCMTKSCILKR
ncbi:DUF4405 domain-containing protein [Candidatus Woesearchaeota archaeon]|nr:DUF4405 domain-containing protein [Candidatus Woesearchaeota archaeon]